MSRRVIGGSRRLAYNDRYDRDDVRGFPCRTCGARLQPDGELDTPDGTLRVKISGEFTAADVQPGSYCGPECLMAECARTFGLTRRDLRAWLNWARRRPGAR